MDRRPVARTVEVDHMEPPRSRLDEPPRHGDRIVREGGLPLEIALLESHHPSTPKVDRRHELEAALSSA